MSRNHLWNFLSGKTNKKKTVRDASRVIGVTSTVVEQPLKLYALLFDQVAVPGLDRDKIDTLATKGRKIAEAEVDFLVERGLLFDADTPNQLEDVQGSQEVMQLHQSFREASNAFSEEMRRLVYLSKARGYSTPTHEELSEVWILHEARGDLKSQFASAFLSERTSHVTVPLLRRFPHRLGVQNQRHSDVVSVVLENLPFPDDAASWEHILEFREDERVRLFHCSLRQWMTHAAAETLTARELAGEIESAVARYQSYMREHRINKSMGTIETVIKASAYGAIAGIGISEAAAVVGTIGSIVVSLRRRKAELIQGGCQEFRVWGIA